MKNVKCKKIVSIIMAFLYFALIVNETIYAKSGDAFLPLKSNELRTAAEYCMIKTQMKSAPWRAQPRL